MNKSKITLIILFFLHGCIVNASMLDDADNFIIDVAYDENNSTVPIQSYRSDQTQFMASNELDWYVIGAPLLVDSSPELTSASLSNVFGLNQNGFSLFFNTLNNAQRLTIVKRIMSEYGVNVSTSQIVTFKLSELKCTTTIFCENQFVEIQGRANSLNHYPIEVNFKAKKSTKACLEHDHFGNLFTRCNHVQYLPRTVNGELLSAFHLNQTDMVDLLFGNANEIFMTRYQLADLVNNICSHFCPNYKPRESIINLDDFINDNNLEFKQLAFEDAFKVLSNYSNIKNTDALEIRSIYGNVFKVKVSYVKWKIYIGINDQMTPRINLTLMSSFGIAESYEYVKENEEIWAESTKPLAEQLKELNWHSRNDVEWEIVGDKLQLKNFNLRKLIKSNVQNGLTFKLFERVVGSFVSSLSFKVIDGKYFFL